MIEINQTRFIVAQPWSCGFRWCL